MHLIIFHNNAPRRRAIINKAGVRNTRVHRCAARIAHTRGERAVCKPGVGINSGAHIREDGSIRIERAFT